MPNTITVDKLRQFYLEKYGKPCELAYNRIAMLWASTAPDRRRGRSISIDELNERAAKTVILMRGKSK